MHKPIDTDEFSAELRRRVLRKEAREILIARLRDSHEAEDDYTHINCDGYGRVRTYRDYTLHLGTASHGPKPLFRGHPPAETLRTQVFQIAACNWRCWYCFVDDDRLSANRRVACYFTAEQLIDMWQQASDPADVLDLSGGQPDLVPEWCLWTMESLERRGLRGHVYVWADDNLSTDYLWHYLSPQQVRYMATFPRHSRVGCFKGFDEASFEHTTRADRALFAYQFNVFERLLACGFDMYAYATFTGPLPSNARTVVRNFVDRLQAVHPLLPLRTVPLRVHPFTATRRRMTLVRERELSVQHIIFDLWQRELDGRFGRRFVNMASDKVQLD